VNLNTIGINMAILMATIVNLAIITPAAAQTTNASPRFAAVTTSSPGFSVSRSSRISWLLEDVEFKKDAPVSNKQAKEIIDEVITREMQNKGLTINSSGTPADSFPDYYIAYTVASESTLDEKTLLQRYRISPGFNPPGTGSQVYEKGTLVIQIIDAKTRQTLWQSVVQANIHTDISDDERKSNVASIVKSMLGKLPVKQ